MALLFTVLCGAAVLILGYFSVYFNRGHFIHGTEAVIDTEIRHITAHDTAIISDMNVPGRVFLLLDPGGSKIAGNLAALPGSVSLLAEGTIVFSLADKKYAAKIHTFPDGRRLLAGVDITAVEADYARMQWLSIVSIVLMLMVIATSYLISHFVVSNTGRIAQTARQIMETGDLSRRIDVKSGWDDLSYMAGVLNDLLGRIEELMQGIRQVSDNIAHDLRTPLTRIRHNIETLKSTLSFDGDGTEQHACDVLLDETDRLLATFNALLRISRIETGRQHSAFAPADLAAVMHDVLELYEPLAEEKGVVLDGSLSAVTRFCDRDLLFQAFANILDNAIKFTPAGGRVNVALLADSGRAVITVVDTGPGIDDADLPKVLERFYRAEKSRHTPGSGLGLSLAAAVVTLHGGGLSLENRNPGLAVTVTL